MTSSSKWLTLIWNVHPCHVMPTSHQLTFFFFYFELWIVSFLESRIKQIDRCISGQSISRAKKSILRIINGIHHYGVIINLGSVDLVQGRELIDMMKDMHELCDVLVKNQIFPILTTLPPLANQMHNVALESKRKAFNAFISTNFDYIDIEVCFLSNYGRIFFDLYQP